VDALERSDVAEIEVLAARESSRAAFNRQVRHTTANVSSSHSIGHAR